MIPSPRSATPPKRILLECGNTLRHALNTGIQRVARNLAREGPAVARELGVSCFPVIYHRGRWRDGGRWVPGPGAASRTGLPGSHPSRTLSAYTRPGGLRARVERTLDRHRLAVTLGQEWRLLRTGEIRPGPGDVVVLGDVWWRAEVVHALEQARRSRARTALVVCDLLPITHPQFFPAVFAPDFRGHLDHHLRTVDFVLTISETVAATIREHAATVTSGRRPGLPPVAVFPLGSTLDLATSVVAPSEAVARVFDPAAGPPPYLAVGTVEPRKNHAYLLDAFERLWRVAPEARLCILGRSGWLCDEILDRIRGHERFGTHLIHLGNADDSELRFCYERSRALLFASHAEGYGLPIVEALGCGTPVFASDIPIHREVGGGSCEYFDLARPEDLASRLIAFDRGGPRPSPRRPDDSRGLDWADCTRKFLQHCLAQAAQGG